MSEPKIKKVKVQDLVFDDRNMNKGTETGKRLLNKSFEKFGAGRSVLLDKNGRLIGDNKFTETFAENGGQEVLIIETDGKTLVAVKRTDIDLDSAVGREMALADNQTQAADYVPDLEVMHELATEYEIDLLAWDVEPRFEEGNSAEGEENTTSLNLMYLVIDNKKIPITDEERNGLNALRRLNF